MEDALKIVGIGDIGDIDGIGGIAADVGANVVAGEEFVGGNVNTADNEVVVA